MKKLLVSAAVAAAILTPSVALAQAVPAAVIAVVDLDRITTECTACKTASAALRAQVTSLQNREKSLATPLQTEQKSIQAAIDALQGKEPDAALQARVKAFQARQQQGAQEVQAQQVQIQRNQQFIQKQISDKLGPIYQSVMQRRGANVMLETGATLATTTSVDVTSDVLAALNTAMPSVSVTAPAAPKPAAPQGR
ncbi:OmpH family outer membrane protein [Sphingomonas sp. URHD0057]|uniref:OmpH family outer membrane protein n=1 Tax=Sphingomonas sp. URHD0057 TaxID=1380389 RepID=UPI0004920134|nr:OmpH family outer membrane protein [Sphingomonas sp. URHD0057]